MVFYIKYRPTLLNGLIELIQKPDVSTAVDEDVDLLQDLEEAGYQASFSRLASAGMIRKKRISDDPSLYLAQSLASLSQVHPGKVQGIIQAQLPQENAKHLNTYMQSAGVSLIR